MIKLRFIGVLILLLLVTVKLFSQQTDTLNLYFDINEYELDPESLFEIDRALWDYEYETCTIEIYAYTDFLGSDDYNIWLSNQRSLNIKNYIALGNTFEDVVFVCEGRGVHNGSSEENRKDLSDRGIASHRLVQVIISCEFDGIEIGMGEIESQPGIVEPDEKIIETVVEEPITIPIFENLDTENLEVGENIVLENILFHGGTPEFKSQSESSLKQLFLVMQKNPDLVIEIQGHICCETGGRDGWDRISQNDRLSENRAKAVYDYLLNGGIEEDRMTYVGFASTQKRYPEERNAFEEDQNRRVEIMIVEK